VPLGLATAIFISEIAPRWGREILTAFTGALILASMAQSSGSVLVAPSRNWLKSPE
jgi:hypothetical protein